MKNNTIKLKGIINKIAAKSFSNKEKAVLLFSFLALAAFGYYHLVNLTNTIKNEIKIVEPMFPKIQNNATGNKLQQTTKPAKKSPQVIKKKDLRDPFLPSKSSEMVKTSTKKRPVFLKLKGILWDRLIPSAIINSKVVKIGDLIFGKTVVDIEKNQVILMENGEIFLLKLKRK